MGLKTPCWEQVDSDRNSVGSRGGNKLYLNQGKPGRYGKQGMDSRNHRKGSLTNWLRWAEGHSHLRDDSRFGEGGEQW